MIRNEPKILSEKEQEFSFVAFAAMEDLLDKLKLLNYEAEFLSNLKMKPIHRYYFVITKNSGEQFYLFTLLSAWLIRKCGKEFENPQEYDDPNDTVAKILDATREFGAVVDFPPNKLKQGVGEQVVYILDCLTNVALKKLNFTFKKPKPPEEKEEELEQVEDESEINLDRVEEEMIAAYSDDDSDGENLFFLENRINKTSTNYIDMNQQKTIINEEEWRMELERVLPQLKITIKNDSRDWRTHLNQMNQFKGNIDELVVPVKKNLNKLHREINSTLEKVSTREKHLNNEVEVALEEYRMLQDHLSKVKDKYKSISSGVAERNRELAKLTDRLENVKQKMEERGSSMTDGTPLVNIKKCVAKMKSEITAMDVRIGVLECILLQSKIRNEKILENEYGELISVF